MRQPPPQLQLVQHFWVGRVVRNDEAGSLLINSDSLGPDDTVLGLQSEWWVMRRSRIRKRIQAHRMVEPIADEQLAADVAICTNHSPVIF